MKYSTMWYQFEGHIDMPSGSIVIGERYTELQELRTFRSWDSLREFCIRRDGDDHSAWAATRELEVLVPNETVGK